MSSRAHPADQAPAEFPTPELLEPESKGAALEPSACVREGVASRELVRAEGGPAERAPDGARDADAAASELASESESLVTDVSEEELVEAEAESEAEAAEAGEYAAVTPEAEDPAPATIPGARLAAAGGYAADLEVAPAELETGSIETALTGDSPAEVSAEELQGTAPAGTDAPRADDLEANPWQGSEAALDSEPRAAYPPPWVDELPDPVTPYEQRVSETIKVADLPPVEQLRGRVLANRYLAEEVAEHTAVSLSYRAYHLALDRAVTVRVLPRGLACSDEACQEVRRVAAVASALEDVHVAATLDFGVLSDGWPFVVTEHFQGNTLATLVKNEGKFVLRRVLHIGKQAAAGLRAAHKAGLVHGLLSPDNVLIVDPGSSAEVVKLLGFGISKARGATPGPPRSGVFGVPFYVSPEQAACRPLDARSDIYSLGVILYELMTGSPPFSDGDFAGVLCQHLDDDAPPPSSRLRAPGALAKAMDAIIERCLRKDVTKRYQTAAELEDDLIRLEAAAARSKRRPMPEVQKPTTTIHSPHPKAEAAHVPDAKVIVHDEEDDPPALSLEAESSSARRSSPSASRASPVPAAGGSAPATGAPASSAGAGSGRSEVSVAKPALAMAPRVRVDQATVKISALDRDRIIALRLPSTPASIPTVGSSSAAGPFAAFAHWAKTRVALVFAALRRFIATATRSGDDAP